MKLMIKQLRRASIVVVAGGLATASTIAGLCATGKHAPDTNVVAKNAAVHKVAAANTAFTFRLLDQLTAHASGKNVFFSPFSVTNALSVALNGAGGSTQHGIATALGLGATPLDQVNQGNGLLLPSLTNPDPKVKLSIANALWANQGYTLSPSFKQRAKTYYDANASTLNFASPSAASTINRWVSQHTEGKIDKIVSPGDLRGGTAVITNAVYFHGTWTDQFKKRDTKQEPFTLAGGAKKTMPLMREDTTVPYLETPQFQAVALPYGSRRISFYVILPKIGVTLGSVAKSMSAKSWESTVASMKPTYLTVVLPRFKADYETTLNRPLASLGMSSAFGAHADFQPMGLRGSAISAVVHKALIQVDEEGTTAAAVTGVYMTASLRMPPKTTVRVDHPFFCAIRDNLTGTVLFAGTIYDPQAM